MSQLVLPHTVDAGTEIVAVEHQANYVAIRDLINGNLEGGGGVDNNLKANGVTAREIEDDFVWGNGPSLHLQQGVIGSGDLKVTPGSGLQLNWAPGTAVIGDPGGIVSGATHLIPVFLSPGSTVTIAANSSGNPRIDRVVATLTGYGVGAATVSVLQGTPTPGATLDNLSGAAAIPAGSLQLASILMPNAFAGPFVQNTHIRDRRGWARGLHVIFPFESGAAHTTNTGVTAVINSAMKQRAEIQSGIVEARFSIGNVSASAANMQAGWDLYVDGVPYGSSYRHITLIPTAGSAMGVEMSWMVTGLGFGTHTFDVQWHVAGGVGTITLQRVSPFIPTWTLREHVLQNGSNGGA